MKKIGRNDPCPCGSGLKYKRCHLNIKGVLQKVSERGSSDPYVVRLTLQIFQIRDFIVADEDARLEFDNLYNPIMQNMLEAELAKNKLREVMHQHKKSVANGTVAKINNGTIEIGEDISLPANLYFKDFFIRGQMALTNLIRWAQLLGYKISFILGPEKEFEGAMRDFVAKHPLPVVKYLIPKIQEERRIWIKELNTMRRKIEHDGFVLPKIVYRPSGGGGVEAIFPGFAPDQTMDDGIEILWNNLFNFVERVVVLLMVPRLPAKLGIVEIPEAQRDRKMPMKYRVVPPPVGDPGLQVVG